MKNEYPPNPSTVLEIKRTNSDDLHFRELVRELDKDLAIRDGEDHAFFAQFNHVDHIRYVVMAFENNIPVGCGAIKEYSENTMEVKRMFVVPNNRGKGIATIILKELETWAHEMEYEKCILETGVKQPEAIRLYHKNDYQIIPNYGQYAGVTASLCFEKKLMKPHQAQL